VAAADRRRSMRRRGAMKFFGCRAAGLVVRRRREVGERRLWERERRMHCAPCRWPCSKKRAGRVTHETRS
jgi:hypothetical protein